jgi:hypothetical protein
MGAQSLAKLLRGRDILGDNRMSWDLRASEAVRCPMAMGDVSPVSCCSLQRLHANSSRMVSIQQFVLGNAEIRLSVCFRHDRMRSKLEQGPSQNAESACAMLAAAAEALLTSSALRMLQNILGSRRPHSR